MAFSMLPTIIADSVTDLSVRLLHQREIKLLMLDFDNTIVPYTTNVPTPEMEHWLREIQASDVKLCVVSNSRNDRVKHFCEKYGLDCITRARKPFPTGIRKCINRYQIPPEHCALAGDQIYTDVMGARGCGVQAILVKAIHNHTIWLKLRHVAEMPFIFISRNRRIPL